MSINEELSFTEYTLTEDTTDFIISFDRIGGSTDEVSILVNNTPIEDLVGYTVLQVNFSTWQVDPALPAGTVVRLARTTNLDKMVYVFTAGSKFIAKNVDYNFKQIQHSQQEIRDRQDKLEGDATALLLEINDVKVIAEQAAEYANEALEKVDEILNTGVVPAGMILTSDGGNQQQFNDTQEVINLYGAKTYDMPSGGYPVGGLVRLDNGDIVKSTVPNNTVNPNLDMTGWELIGSRVANDVSELRLIRPLKKGGRAYLKSYIADNGKGGGNFIATQKSGLVDNGATIFSSPNPSIFWVRVNFDSLTPEMVGATGDGVTDDANALQDFVKKVIELKLPTAIESPEYATSKTIIIPQVFDTTFIKDALHDLNFHTTNFVLLEDVTLFTSGYTDGSGDLVSNYGTPKMSHNTFGVRLGNFTISSAIPLVNYPESTALMIQDWHQSCEIYNIKTHIFKSFLKSNNNFYTKFVGLSASYSGGGNVGSRFEFDGENNLCTFKYLVAVNSDIGYHFKGLTTACTFTENSVEGVNVGLQFEVAVYGFGFYNNYCENFGTVLKFNSYYQSVDCDNNYVNYVAFPSSSYFLEYNPLPGCGIEIKSSNFFTSYTHSNHIVKNIENTYGGGIVIYEEPTTSGNIDDLISPLSLSLNSQVKKSLKFTGFRAHTTHSHNEAFYSGKFTEGYDGKNGFKWNNLGTTELQLDTKILDNKTQRIYVNITCVIDGANVFIKGELWGGYPARFYEYTDTGVSVSSKLSITNAGGFTRIGGTLSGVPTDVKGEVRLI